MEQWIADLKPGDTVVVRGRIDSLRKVEKTTATQVTVGFTRFRKDTGREIGGGAWSGYLVQPTPELVAHIQRSERMRALVHRLGGIAWRSVPLETLEAIAALLPVENAR